MSEAPAIDIISVPAAMDGEHMQHGRRLAVGDVGYQRGQVIDIVTRSIWDAALTQTAKASQRRPSQEWRLAPCGSADTRCANLRAIFDYVVLALSTNFGTNRLGLGTAEPGAASILKGSMSGCELCCAPKSGMAPRRPFS